MTATGRGGRDRALVSPVLVSDQTSLEVLGLDARQFRRLLVERQIPHVVAHRHVVARVEHVVRALGLGDADAEPESSPRPVEWSEDEAVARLARRGRRA